MTKTERNLWVAILLAALAVFVLAAVGASAQCPSPPMSGDRIYTLLSIVDQEDPDNPGQRRVLVTPFRVNGPKVTFQPYNHNLPIVGQEWWLEEVLLKSCGDTGRTYNTIFSDGFESGDFAGWTGTIGG